MPIAFSSSFFLSVVKGDLDISLILVLGEQLPPVLVSNGHKNGGRDIMLGGNVHNTCLTVIEPDANEEFTEDKEAYVASHFYINNVGDPFVESNYGVHLRQFEVAVFDWREVFPDGILYASRDSHYSVFKAARMYKMECMKVDTLVSGEIDSADFKVKLLANKDKPAIINVNIGTTVKGAVDDPEVVIKALEETRFTHDQFYIYCDGALFGLMMPFVKCALKVSFKKPIGSVSVYGHKWIGCPMPCGILMTRLEHINALSSNAEYLVSRDATIMENRNGHVPIFLWYTLNKKGYKRFQKEVHICLRNAHYLKNCLLAAGISAMLNENSDMVVFERPLDEKFVRRWQSACQGNITHIVVMPNVTIEKLDDFFDELVEKCSSWYQWENSSLLVLQERLGARIVFVPYITEF
ncbi:hypothetical protein CIPAW_16G014200 [Carya illinoinensis]|uniref:Uncharacterized protein n=1 Tax=Carya illinoinensis TaxID=32201 RepID=A0A8T1N2S3_CARIL|nr:hypothetical protein CIPAW_16G014200 [Carya illinoinensis]